jgi:hypothetical protein
MWIIKRNLLGEKDLLHGFVAYNEDDLKDLKKFCEDLNECKKASYKIINLEDQFICACCNELYYNKHLNRHECECGAIRCEFCEDVGKCECGDDELESFFEDDDDYQNYFDRNEYLTGIDD